MKKAVVLRELDALMAKLRDRQGIMLTESDSLGARSEYRYSCEGAHALRVAMVLLGDTIAALRQMK